jgi:hypothetical protein
MSEPKTITEALSALKASQEQVTALQADLASANELLTEAQNASKQITDLQALNAELAAEKVILEARLQELTVAAQASEARVTEAVASLGVPPVAIAFDGAVAKTKEELWAEYRQLPVEARNDFYRANRATLKSN